LSTFQTVEWPKPAAPAIGRGPDRSRGGRRRSPPPAPGEQPRAAMRPAGTIQQTRQALTRLLARVFPTVPPGVGRRRRHAEAGRGLLSASSRPRSPKRAR